MNQMDDDSTARPIPSIQTRERKAWHTPELLMHSIEDAQNEITGFTEDATFGFEPS